MQQNDPSRVADVLVNTRAASNNSWLIHWHLCQTASAGYGCAYRNLSTIPEKCLLKTIGNLLRQKFVPGL